MLVRASVVLATLGLGGWWLQVGRDYQRTIDLPPEAVRAELLDLDIVEPIGGSGGSGVKGHAKPTFSVTSSTDEVRYTVSTNGKPAMVLIAHLDLVDGGHATRVRAEAVKADAPDADVPPGFRSRLMSQTLFSAALDRQLDRIEPKAEDADATDDRDESTTPREAANEYRRHSERSQRDAVRPMTDLSQFR